MLLVTSVVVVILIKMDASHALLLVHHAITVAKTTTLLSAVLANHQKEKRQNVRSATIEEEESHSVSENDEENNSTVHLFQIKTKNTPYTNVLIDGQNIRCVIDSGASVNIIDEAQFNKINCSIRKANIKIFTYGASTPLKVLGVFNAKIKAPE